MAAFITISFALPLTAWHPALPCLQGVLTITLVRCVGLEAPNGGKDLQTYVRFVAADDSSDAPDIAQVKTAADIAQV